MFRSSTPAFGICMIPASARFLFAPRNAVKSRSYAGFTQDTRRCYSGYSLEKGELLVTKENKVLTVTLNRPKKYNAYTKWMYDGIVGIFSEAAVDESVSVVVLTGAGKYFCSGNDLGNFKEFTLANIEEKAKEGAEIVERYVAAHIDFPKPLIAAVNGPALGIGVTSLGFFDAVYSSDDATFLTPFSKTQQIPEACSSYIFPKIMGYARASRLLLFDEMLSAAEAEKLSLVNKVFPSSNFHQNVQKEVEKILKLPLTTIIKSKSLLRGWDRDVLHKVNKEEVERLIEQWTSEDFVKNIAAFLTKS